METAIVVGLVVAVVSGGASAHLATSKGHSGTGYFWLGFFLPLIGILVAGFMPPAEPSRHRPARRSVPPSSPTSSFGSASRGETVSAGASAITDLRPSGDRRTDTLLRTYGPKFDFAVRLCAVGERVLAFGIAMWKSQKVLFLLTDRRFILLDVVSGRAVDAASLDTVEFDVEDGSLQWQGTVFDVTSRSPFSSSEVADLIRDRNQTVEYVEVIAPGQLAPPKPPDIAQPVAEATGNVADTVGEIERLDALHQSGAIDDAEFAELKRRLVWGDDGPVESSG